MNSEKKLAFIQKIKNRGVPRLSHRELRDGFLSAATAFILGICPIPFSVYPLGIVFFCASSGSAAFAFVGVLAASFFTELVPIVYLSAVLIALLLRIIMRLFIDVPQRVADKPTIKELSDVIGGRFFCESVSLRVACASLSVFALSCYPIVIGGFRYYDLFGAILSILVSVVGVPVFSWAFEDGEKQNSILKRIGKTLVAALLCFSFSNISVQGISLGLAAAFVFTVSLCASDGIGASMTAAAVCGAVCGFEMIPILAVCAFTAYCLVDNSPLLFAAVSCVAGSVCGIAVLGSAFMTDSFLSLLSGCAFYSMAKKLTVGMNAARTEQKTNARLSFMGQEKESLSYRLLKDSASTFENLSEFASIFVYAKELSEHLTKYAETESAENTELSRALAHRLYELGFGRPSVEVRGKREIKVIVEGERLSGSYERLDFIRRRAEQLVGFPLSLPKTDENGKRLFLKRESVISYHHAIATSPKEDVCGDTATVFFDDQRNLLFALICDGMGSGEKAAEISMKAASLLKLLLLGGLTPEKALLALVGFLRSEKSSDEISTTVDLLVLDLYDGKASLIKSGSAPSYIIKKDEIVRLSSRTYPMGIFEHADYEKQRFELKSGDVFIMASDGVSETEDDGIALLDYLDSHRGAPPEDMTSEIIELSRKEGRRDDLSVIVVKLFPQDY